MRWMPSRLLILAGVAVVALLSGCKGTGSVRKVASVSISFQVPPDGPTESYSKGKEFALASASAQKPSELDVRIFNIGEADMKILNVYLAAGSNKYVELIWPETDPSGEAKYSTLEAVRSCPPDRSVVSDPTLLPDARDPNPGDCIFPFLLKGSEGTQLFESRKVRLRYKFDSVTQEPDTAPVELVIHIDNREDKLTEDGVIKVSIKVNACTGKLLKSTPGLTFTAAKPNNPETLEVCLFNEGCADLVIKGVALEKPSGEFTLLDAQTVIGATIAPNTLTPGDNNCFDVRYLPQDATSDTNRVVIESSDPSQPTAFINLTSGDCAYDYELSHSDDVESGLGPLDFTTVSFPDTGKKIINLRNTGDCPLKLNELALQPVDETLSKGGTLCAEVKKAGASAGGIGGCPGVGAFAPVILGQKDQTLDVEINYVPREDNAGSGGSVKLVLFAQGNEIPAVELPILAGEPKAKIAIGPSQAGGSIGQLTWYAQVGEVKCTTAAIYNYGYKALQVVDVTLEKGFGQPVTDFYFKEAAGVFDGSGAFKAQSLGAQGLIPITVCFAPQPTSSFNPKAFVRIYTDNPDLPPATAEVSFSLTGFVGVNKKLPEVNPGTTAEYAGYSAPDTVTLVASSTDGEYPVAAQGYIWWLAGKPEGSAAKLNGVGVGPTQTFVADRAGTYRVFVQVFAVGTGADKDVLYSDAVSVDVVVD